MRVAAGDGGEEDGEKGGSKREKKPWRAGESW